MTAVSEQTTTDQAADERSARNAGAVQTLMRLADALAPMAVRVLATLRVPDYLAEGPASAATLAEAVGADEDALRRLLRYLVARDVLAEPRPDSFELAPMARLLLDEHPARLRAAFDLDGPVGRADRSFAHLRHSITTGEPAYPQVFGQGFWEELAEHPDQLAHFNELMAERVTRIGLAGAHPWAEVGEVVDVGGGDGTLLAELLTAHPHLRGTLVELPSTAEQARSTLHAAGVADRTEVVGGSFLEPLPAGRDVYVLAAVLHNWPDREAAEVLQRCAAALPPHGCVLVVETLPDDARDPRDVTYRDLHMLCYFGGKERTLDDYRSLAASAGLRLAEVRPRNKFGLAVIELLADGT